MSTTIDQKVVEMQFDNKQFESGVSTSISSIETLKKSLDMKGASKGLENIDAAAKKCDLSGLNKGIETVHAKFTAMEVVGITALANITNAAINAGTRIASSLTIDPIFTGYKEYETQMNAVQTILANTQSKGSTLDDVNRALNELNHYADQTIYNFTEMTKNIGRFTAAGVDLDRAVGAIKGIANLAAVSGSSSYQASNAMYQLSQALATNRVTLMDWNSVVNAGMGGEVFQNALKRTARNQGEDVDAMIEKYGSFRESLTRGEWLTADVLNETLNQIAGVYDKADLLAKGYTESQADEILKLAETAIAAATEVKTFTQLLSTLQEAAGSGWAQTWQLIVGDFGEAKELLTEISNVMSGLINGMADSRNDLLRGGLATGWKQLLNEGIHDTEGYKEAIIEVAKEHGVSVDEIIEKNETFEKSLKEGWLTSDILAESLTKLADKTRGLSDEELKALGYTREQVKALEEFEAKVKDGSISLEDFAMKMARASGRENIIEGLTNAFIGLKSVLQPIGWAYKEVFEAMDPEQLYALTERFRDFTATLKLGGTDMQNLKRTFKGLFAVAHIVTEAFTALFDAVFSIFGITGDIGGGILSITAKFGDLLVALDKTVTKSEIFKVVFGGIAELIKMAADAIKNFAKHISSSFDFSFFELLERFLDNIMARFEAFSGLEFGAGFLDALKAIWDVLKTVGSYLVEGINELLGNLFAGLESPQFDKILDIMNTGFFGWIAKSIMTISELGGVTNVMEELTRSLQLFQNTLNAEIILKIASAVGILAVSVLLLSTIDSEKMALSLLSIGILFQYLMKSLTAFSELGDLKHVVGGIAMLHAMAIAVLILAGALKVVSSLGWEEMTRGLLGIGVMMGILVKSMEYLATDKDTIIKGAGQMILMAVALSILAGALRSVAGLGWEELARGLLGLVGIAIILGALAKVMTTDGEKFVAGAGQMLIMAAALALLAGALRIISGIGWEELARGLLGLAGIATILAVLTHVMTTDGKTFVQGAGQMLVAALALGVLAGALKLTGSMGWEEVARGLIAIGGAMAILVIGLNQMKYTTEGSASLVVAALALAILTPVLLALGNMSWESIAKGLITLAAAFVILGVAGHFIGGLAPVIISLAGSIALIGAGVLAVGLGLMAAGTGLALVAAGFTALAASLSAGAASIVAGLTIVITGIIELIPLILIQIAEGIIGICEVIAQAAPAIGEAIKAVVRMLIDVLVTCVPELTAGAMILLISLLDGLVEYGPQIVEKLFQFFIEIINQLGAKIPDIVAAVMNLLGNIFDAIINAFGGFSPESLFKAITAVGMISALVVVLDFIKTFIPGAMVGVLGIGAIIAEMALILAALGALAQIPGLEWLIGEGGDLLQQIGTALGQFIGGLVGGIAEGATSTLPQVATNLSDFMTNLQPFLESANSIDASSMEGVKALAGVILTLTASNLLDAVTSFITGGRNLTTFAEQLVPFGSAMKAYSDEVSGLDTASIVASAAAAKALTEVANAIPADNGLWQLIAGGRDLGVFGEQLKLFGTAMKDYATEVTGIDAAAIIASSTAAQALVDVANNIPADNGLWQLIAGGQDLGDFGAQLVTFAGKLKEYSDAVLEVNGAAIASTVTFANSVIALCKSLLEVDYSGLEEFKIDTLGGAIKDYYTSISEVDQNVITNSITIANQLKDFINSLTTIDTSGVEKFKDAIYDLGTVSLGDFSTAFSESASALAQAGSQLVDAIANGARSKATSLSGVANELATTMIGTFQTNTLAFNAAGVSLMGEFISGLETEGAKVKMAVDTAITTAASGIITHQTSFYDGGVWLGQGLVNGINAMKTAAYNAGFALGQEAARGEHDGQESGSPSKLTYQEGLWFGEGLVNGINKMASAVYNAGYGMGKTATNSISDALSRANNLINGDMVTQPTIRPVVDLSAAAAGASALNNLFADGQSFAVSANTSAISAMMNRRQNGPASEVVSAIDKLGKSLDNLPTNTYSFNGLTYTESSDVAEAIQTLAKAAMIERRV